MSIERETGSDFVCFFLRQKLGNGERRELVGPKMVKEEEVICKKNKFIPHPLLLR